jgi:putative membrane protein
MSFTQHMAWHMTLVAVAAPIAAARLSGTRLDPVRRAPTLFSPLVACLLEFIVVWTWHTPAMHAAARHDAAWFAAEQISFAGAALFLWMAILGGPAVERSERAGAGVIALALTFAHMTMLGVLIALTPRELYGHALLADQQMGGAVMIAAGAVAYPAAAIWLSRSALVGAAGGRPS